jgi:hypothetical protein
MTVNLWNFLKLILCFFFFPRPTIMTFQIVRFSEGPRDSPRDLLKLRNLNILCMPNRVLASLLINSELHLLPIY